ncbi:hypothetical protein MOXK02_16040 [Moraxella sp. K02]
MSLSESTSLSNSWANRWGFNSAADMAATGLTELFDCIRYLTDDKPINKPMMTLSAINDALFIGKIANKKKHLT